MQLSQIVFVVGLVVAVLTLLPLLVGGVFVLVVVSNRADPDPSGRRPAVVYGFATAFITLFITLFATTALVASLCDLIGPHHGGRHGVFGGISGGGGGFGSQHPVGDAVARGSVLSIIVALVAGIIYWLHVTAAARASVGAPATDPVARVRSSYVAAVSFVCVFLIVVSTVIAVYDVFRILGPGVFSPGTDNRVVVLRSLLPAVYLAIAALALLLMHLRQAPPSLRPRYANRMPPGPLGGDPGAPEAPAAVAPVTPAPPVEPPAAPTTAAEPTAAAPRRRAPRKTTPPPS